MESTGNNICKSLSKLLSVLFVNHSVTTKAMSKSTDCPKVAVASPYKG